MISFILNDKNYSTKLPPGAVTLDLIRSEAGLTGTKEGCREGDCGACTVLLGIPLQQGIKYMAVNSCILPVGELRGRHLVTIEGVNPKDGLSSIQKIFVEEGASQCGFCTPGIIMSLTGYLLNTIDPFDTGAAGSLGGNICRCTGYVSIRNAAKNISGLIGPSPAGSCYSREQHGLIFISSRSSRIGMCASPLAPPPPRARPSLILFFLPSGVFLPRRLRILFVR